jgi:hypothetical protein
MYVATVWQAGKGKGTARGWRGATGFPNYHLLLTYLPVMPTVIHHECMSHESLIAIAMRLRGN